MFGTDQLAGAQAQYVRVPLADTTVVKAPDGLRPTSLVLMADVFPTGVSRLLILLFLSAAFVHSSGQSCGHNPSTLSDLTPLILFPLVVFRRL